MKIGDRIIITEGRYKDEQATVMNVLDFNKVIVRINNIDIAINKEQYIKMGEKRKWKIK